MKWPRLLILNVVLANLGSLDAAAQTKSATGKLLVIPLAATSEMKQTAAALDSLLLQSVHGLKRYKVLGLRRARLHHTLRRLPK